MSHAGHPDSDAATADEYAKAVLDLAPDADQARAVGEALNALASAAASDEAIWDFLIDPNIDPADKRHLVGRALGEEASRLLLDFLSVVFVNDRGELIGRIADAFRTRLVEREGKVRVTVRSAAPLPEETADRIRDSLRDLLAGEPVIESRVDPSLVGGLRVEVGDRVLDASVRGALGRLARRLSERGRGAGEARWAT